MKIWLFSAALAALIALQNWTQGRVLTLMESRGTTSGTPVDVLVGPIDLSPASRQQDSSRSHAHPHGDQVCASGCARSRHPTEPLTQVRFETLVSRLVVDSADQDAIDELLYYGPQTEANLMTSRSAAVRSLSQNVRQRLARELRRSRAVVELRLVSESGTLLADLPAQIVPLDLRHEFDLRENGIPSLLASGTVKRVGEYRLWSRL